MPIYEDVNYLRFPPRVLLQFFDPLDKQFVGNMTDSAQGNCNLLED